jgi:diaminopimelate epimerase
MTVTKYSGNGNDFVILIAQEREDRAELARELCHRQNGVGADGLVVILPHKRYDFEWEFYNADGSHADMCGNASRCVAHYAHDKGISRGGEAEFLTAAGVIRATINGLYVVSEMITPHSIQEDIVEEGESWWYINTGVPHLVAIRDSVSEFDIEKARALRHKYDCNVNICSIKNDTMHIRTYERGVENETLACGTGIVACFVRGFKEEKTSEKVKVHPKSGDELYVSFEDDAYKFGGRVTKVFVAEMTS